jgi:hypothetical protein
MGFTSTGPELGLLEQVASIAARKRIITQSFSASMQKTPRSVFNVIKKSSCQLVKTGYGRLKVLITTWKI